MGIKAWGKKHKAPPWLLNDDVCANILPGQKGQYIVSTAVDSPAEKAGVDTGDRLIWINGVMASTLTHSALIKTVRV